MVRYIIIYYSHFLSSLRLGSPFYPSFFFVDSLLLSLERSITRSLFYINSFSLIFIDKGYVKVQLGWQVNSVRGVQAPTSAEPSQQKKCKPPTPRNIPYIKNQSCINSWCII